jgi:hypothetical protein
MGRFTAFLLLAGCISLPVWAQETQEPKPASRPGSAATQEKSANQATPSESKPASTSGTQSASAPATESNEFWLDRFPEFSAIMMGSVLPGHDDPRHIYRSHDMMRMEADREDPSYYITNIKKRQTHGLAASGCLFMRTPYSRAFPFYVAEPDGKYTYRTVGQDTIDGHPVKIVDVTITIPKHPEIPLKFFEAQDLNGFPVRIENRREHGARWVLEYKDVRLGPQDPSLFVVPDKCQDERTINGANLGKTAPATPAKPKK